MRFTAGNRLGSYEIISALGAGGMGEVYRARDTKLGRDVALKLLPDTFVNEPERVARFQREAQLLAALNHPQIGAIYGLEQSEGSQFLVLELVDGETLAQRIARGPVPLVEALGIARQVIAALEAAHDKGIIHRDLKPANIALTAEGQVKVLDFGLAKAMEPESGGELSHSPTLTFQATRAGVILGTAAYMSPEQAKGRVADKRSDVWAFGCVLFEMLTGKKAFEGEDISDTLAAILRGEPDWTALPSGVPPAVRAIIGRCLEKDRQARIPDVSVVRFLLDDAPAAGSGIQPAAVTVANARTRVQGAVPWAVAGILAIALTAVVMRWAPWREAAPAGPLRLTAGLGADVSLAVGVGTASVLSPDGRVLAFIAQAMPADPPQIYVRRLDQLQAAPISSTSGASNLFFSPDSRWIAFFAGGKLKKIAVTGGAAVTLCDAPSGRGTWADDDTIVFEPTATSGLSRVSATGGKAEPLTTLAEGESSHRWAQVLPGGKAVLYTAGLGGSYDNANLVVQPLPTGTPKIVLRGGYNGRYLPSGHLVYMHESTLFASAFDLGRLEVSGQAVPVLEGVTGNDANGVAQFSVADNGTLVYQSGKGTTSDAPIEWMNRTGKTVPLRAMPSNWTNPSFAPDGKRLAVDISDGTQADVWIYEWARDTLTRMTFDATDDVRPAWTPDSRRIAFGSKRGDKAVFNLYWQKADGTGEIQRLTESKNNQLPGSWHPSGKFFAFDEVAPSSGRDLMILPMEGDEATGWKPGKPTVFLSTPFNEGSPMFSPDGRWIAYISNESGRNEIYVRPFPGPGGKWQVSTGQADDPTWSRARHELFYASATDLRIMLAPYTVEGDSFHADKPRTWSDGRIAPRPRPPSRDLDLHPDGERFAISGAPDQAAAKEDKVVFVFNFFDELRRLAPAKK